MRAYALATSALMILVCAVAAPALTVQAPSTTTPSIAAPDWSDIDYTRAILDAVNTERAAMSVAPIAWDPALAAAAASHVEDMVMRNYFDHDSREGETVRDRVSAQAADAFPLLRQTLWEARNHADWRPKGLADKIVRDWALHISRYQAMLDPAVTHAGAAINRDARDGRAVMVFGGTPRPFI